MKRLTAEEVAERFAKEPGGDVWRVAHIECASVVRTNLIPQWQDEPEEGPCWVRGVDYICTVYRWSTDDGTEAERGGWSIEYISVLDNGISEMKWEPLNGRQVCPIGARPKP